MESYLANIDIYMQRQQQQQDLLQKQRQQQLLLQQQQQQQQQNVAMQQMSSPPQQEHDMNESWLKNISDLPYIDNSYMPNLSSGYYNGGELSNNGYTNSHSCMDTYFNQPTNYLKPLHPQRALGIHEPPIRFRKKPGRKPNPISPAVRKAQNRAAQRAFRERKEYHLKDLETTIRTLREQSNTTIKELETAKGELEIYKAENWYLKGILMTLQFIMMLCNTYIPAHAPYLFKETMDEIKVNAPYAIDAYTDAYKKNDYQLKVAMASHFVDEKEKHQQQQEHIQLQKQRGSVSPSATYKEGNDMEYEDDAEYETYPSPPRDLLCPDIINNSRLAWLKKLDDYPASLDCADEAKTPSETVAEISVEEAIKHIRLRLSQQYRLGSKSNRMLRPTMLQLAIPHDPRIDLLPTPHARDRFILFRNHIDLNHAFSLLLRGAIFHGGDPTVSDNWELPPEFYQHYWYLTIDYDLQRTNLWRRQRGLQDIKLSALAPSKPLREFVPLPGSDDLFDDKIFEEIVNQSLKATTSQDGAVTPPMEKNSIGSPNFLFKRMMTAPETREKSPDTNIETLIELIKKNI